CARRDYYGSDDYW
nr:immunoglobulin heavy chain junction region [Mus musculus]MBK4195668.1 immunoglobulin heavy chain junction region [Mus musculus]MBK4195670.1 immunoglobulin heavy chain junction region [Mus musculus]